MDRTNIIEICKCKNKLAIIGESIYFKYPLGSYIFEDFSFKIVKGCINLIAGRNGAGKSTLLKLIAGIEKPNSGIIEYTIEKNISYVPQHTNIKDNFPISGYDVMMMGFLNTKIKASNISIQIEKVAQGLLLPTNLLKKSYCDLSGGQRQKVLLGRALVCESEIVILDEPFSNIDKESLATISQNIENIKKTIVIVSHIDIDSHHIITLN